MKISAEDVRYIARLAKLGFTEEEIQRLVKDFQGILSHFETIDRLDLSDVKLDLVNENSESVLRKDEASVFEDKEKLFSNIKSIRGTFITVPKIIE